MASGSAAVKGTEPWPALRGTHGQAKPGSNGDHRRGLGLWPMGLVEPAAGLERVGSGLWARPKLGGLLFFLFLEIFFQRKNKFGNSRKCLQGTKNTPKITKISGKFRRLIET
jgi:hypothetical protein